MFDIKQLDKEKTYCLGKMGTNWVSRKIQELSYSLTLWDVPYDERWSHVAILYWDNELEEWNVIESHFLDKGVVERTFAKWIESNNNLLRGNGAELFQLDLNIKVAKEILSKRMSYGTRDIFWFWLFHRFRFKPFTWLNLRKPDRKGCTCSELVAIVDNRLSVAEFFDQPSHAIRPNDFKLYALHKRIKILKVF